MKPLSPSSNKGRRVSGDDVHHRTADQTRAGAKTSAKMLKHSARQQAKRKIAAAIIDSIEARTP